MTSWSLRAAREQLGLSQEALAHALGKSLMTVQRWEGLADTPTLVKLAMLGLASLRSNGNSDKPVDCRRYDPATMRELTERERDRLPIGSLFYVWRASHPNYDPAIRYLYEKVSSNADNRVHLSSLSDFALEIPHATNDQQ